MTRLATWGLEFEVQTEAPALVRRLHEQGHCQSAEMHSWHCGCPACRADTRDHLFYAQTDSSCSGEVITRIMHHDPENEWHHPDVFDILQDAALDVDAEPGEGAGMHVHVGHEGLTANEKGLLLYAYLRWEPVLLHVATGRWGYHRGNNETVREQCYGTFGDWVCVGRWPAMFEEAAQLTSEDFRYFTRDLVTYHGEHDRHSMLNLNTGGKPTWEFRLWNSTRSAWRMEMFTRLSVALMDPTVAKALIACDYPEHVDYDTIDRLCVLLHDADHERAAELLYRQNEYLARTTNAPAALTTF